MSEITVVSTKAHAMFDGSNSTFQAAHMAMEAVFNFAGFESSDFENAKVVMIYAMVGSSEALSLLTKCYTPEKFYIILCLKQRDDVKDLPANVWWLTQDEVLSKIMIVINQESATFDAKIALAKGKSSHLEVPVVNTVGASGKQVLVLDDSPVNRDRVQVILGVHSLTIASSYAQAMKLLGENKYDAVLTDLYLPISSYHGAYSIKCADIGRLVPYGALIANEAKRKGALAAIVTDANHHGDPFSAAFDEGGDKAGVVYNNHKDWQAALNKLLS